MKKILLFLNLLLAITITLRAQCPETINATANATATTCSSNGTITITANVDATATYQIISGPNGPSALQSTNLFSSLKPGDYTIEIICSSVKATVNATVPNQYTPPTIAATVTDVCGSGHPGGTITVSGTGSSVKYGILMSNDANAADNLFTYGNLNTFNVQAFGTYQLRVKDGCDNFVTQTVQVLPQSPKGYFAFYGNGFGYPNCNTITATGDMSTSPNAGEGLLIDYTGLNYTLEYWENTATGCPAGLPAGPPTKTLTLNNRTGLLPFSFSNTVKSIFWRVTSPCGEVTTGCANVLEFSLFVQPAVKTGCNSTGDATNTIGFRTNGPGPYTVKVTGYSVTPGGDVVAFPEQTLTSTGTIFNNIPPADYYTYVFSDNCGHTQSGKIPVTPAGGNTATVGISLLGNYPRCDGNVDLIVAFTGYIPGLNNTTAQISLVNNITGQTFTTSTTGITVNEGAVRSGFGAVPPGQYTVTITPGGTCTSITTFPFTVPSKAPNFILTGTVQQLCGGTGTITTTARYSEGGSNPSPLPGSGYSYILKDNTGNEVARNTGGVFANMPAGNYTVQLEYPANCREGGKKNYYSNSMPFTITANGAPPQTNAKYGIICDNGNGGLIALSLAGSGPFQIELKNSSDPETAFKVITTQAPDQYVIANITTTQTQDVRITDQCGNTATTQVSMAPLRAPQRLTTTNPCQGQPYSLKVEAIPGATYSWAFNGTPIGNQSGPELYFASYSPVNNGSYEVTVSLGSCFVRKVAFNISSTLCDQPLSATIGSIKAVLSSGKLQVSWTTLTEENVKLYEVEVSQDGKTFRRAGTVDVLSKGGNSNKEQAYTFETPVSEMARVLSITFLGLLLTGSCKKRRWWGVMAGLVLIAGTTVISCKRTSELSEKNAAALYVRVAIIDKDGSKSYTKIVKATEE